MRIKIPHHSLADWDYPTASWQLYDYRYISAPTCVRSHTDRTSGYTWIFLKNTIAPNIPHGRIISYLWHRSASSGFPKWSFRAQALPPGQGATDNNPANCYQVSIDSSGPNSTRIMIVRIVNKVPTTLYSNIDPEWPDIWRIWSQWRVTWFSYITPEFTSMFRIIVDGWDGSDWQQCVELDDSQNRWEESSVNLVGICGFGWNIDPDYYDCLDDTEVWKKT